MFFSHSNDAIQIQAEECSSADYLLAKKFSHSLEVQHIHKGVHAWQVSLESWCAWRARGGSVEVWSLMFKTDCVMSHVLVGVKMGSSSCDWAELWTARGCTWFWPLCKKEVPSGFFWSWCMGTSSESFSHARLKCLWKHWLKWARLLNISNLTQFYAAVA